MGAMNNLLRLFSLCILVVAPLALFGKHDGAKHSPATVYRAYVGTYTGKTGSKGIYEFNLDAATGKMSAVEVAAETTAPSWVVVHPNGKYLYAANEDGKESAVSAFAIEQKTGKLILLNKLPALGEDPCYLSFDHTGKFLFVANYSSGTVAAFPILPDGKLGEHGASLKNVGALGPNKERQNGPHAHWIEPSLDNQFVYVADLGLDSVLIYRFDPSLANFGKPVLGLIEVENKGIYGAAALAPGAGPRHVAFSRNRKFMYVLGEINSTVTVFSKEQSQAFRTIQSVSTLPAGFSGRNDTAEIEMHPNGKFLYASNRGHDSIVVYAIEPDQGTLKQIAEVPTAGKEPRNFAIDPSGKFLLAENQNTNSIVEFRIDPSTGKLSPTGESLSVPSPVCLTFLAVR
jgi:6-phosphogluconolactonase